MTRSRGHAWWFYVIEYGLAFLIYAPLWKWSGLTNDDLGQWVAGVLMAIPIIRLGEMVAELVEVYFGR